MTAALAFAAAACGAAGFALVCPWPPRFGRAAQVASHGETNAAPPRPIRLLVAGGRRLRPPGAPRHLAARIEAAGRPAGLGAREIMAAKAASALMAGVAALPLPALAPGRLGLVLWPAAAVAGFLTPDAWLGRLAAERARRVRRDLPPLLDMLRVTVDAGGSLTGSLRAVGERASGPLAREWQAVADEVELGVPLAEALDALARRLPQNEIRALVGALDRTRRHGAPLSDTLAAQARAARFALARRIREDAARAGPKIQLVVALLLVPSVLLLVAAALASALLDGSADAVPL